MAEIAGFWSYVHDDNEAVGGAIVDLSDALKNIFGLLGGGPLKLFVDRDIEWGEQWEQRIDRELQETTFFIPIVTPRYFQSSECRRELVEFKSAADRFGVQQLLLPIYYVTVPEMEEPEPDDELIAMVKSIQREDMRKVRLRDPQEAIHRQLVDRLANRLLAISRLTEGLPTPPDEVVEKDEGGETGEEDQGLGAVREPSSPPSRDGGAVGQIVGPGGGDEAGTLDTLAAGETALEDWGQTLGDLSAEVADLGEIVTAATPKLQSATSFAAKLVAANHLAEQLKGPAERLNDIGKRNAAHLIAVDPAIQQLLQEIRADPEVAADPETRMGAKSILDMTEISKDAMGQITVLIDSMEPAAQASRELRQPIRVIQTALRNVTDGQQVFDDWERQIRQIFGSSLDDIVVD